jgi:GNAT superfamily N-acetyltransferase
MPAMLDDPASPTIFRVSGQQPYPESNQPGLPEDILPRQVTLRDRQTMATVVPFASRDQVPASLTAYLCDQLNREIEGGDTYPMMDPFEPGPFASYWFQNFAAVMLLGDLDGPQDVVEGKDWSRECLGSFYIKPNYPGRSSHVCNAGFLVTDASRNRGVGRLMGEAYIDWAPRLGYTYSVFNLVYETNVASCKIWDALGFKRIGRVKGCGNLRSYPDRLIDAIIYGRDLAPGESEELVSEERFDKIKFYLKYGKYPNGSDRAEKSRLRSAATHYKLLEGDKLMLKDKEVISDPVTQYDIARAVHAQHHGGINKTTATIAEKYHWSRIKETVSDVIRNCTECKDLGKTTPNPSGATPARPRPVATVAAAGAAASASSAIPVMDSQSVFSTTTTAVVGVGVDGLDHTTSSSMGVGDAESRMFGLQDHDIMATLPQQNSGADTGGYANPSDISVIPSSHAFNGPYQSHHGQQKQPHHSPPSHQHHNPMLQDQSHPHDVHHPHHGSADHHHQEPHHRAESPMYQPIDPQIINQPPPPQDATNPFEQYHSHDASADFQALLNATGDDDEDHRMNDDDAAAVDRDLEMLIEHGDGDEEEENHRDAQTSIGRQDGKMGKGGEEKEGLYNVEFGESGG